MVSKSTRRKPQSFVVAIIGFAIAVTALLWWQAQRSQDLLRDQVLLQAEQRSLHLADAMAGQIQAQLNIADMMLRDLRQEWALGPKALFDNRVRAALTALPSGLVSHVSVADAAGYLTYNSLGQEGLVYVGDREHFLALRAGADELRVSVPVQSRLTGNWVFLVGRPVLEDGQFKGVIYLLMQSEEIAQRLASLTLSDQDVVSLIHPNGDYLARSKDNKPSMGRQVPIDRPFFADPTLSQGTYRIGKTPDHDARTYC